MGRKPQPLLAACGTPGLRRSGGTLAEEFLTDLKGATGRKKYREMADNDPTIGAALYLTESLLKSVSWECEANDSGAPRAGQCQEFVASAFEDMAQSWQEIMSEVCSAFVFGWCVLEPTYKLRRGEHAEPSINSVHNDGLIGWLDWEPRPQESLDHWEFSDTGRLLGMWQRDDSLAVNAFLPIDRMLHFRFRGTKKNPEGRSQLRTPYTSYYYAKRLREVEGIGIERDAAGLPIASVPPELLHPKANTAQKEMLQYWKDLVANIRVDSMAGVVRPCSETPDGRKTGYDLELLSSSGKSFGHIDAVIQRYERHMLRAFLCEMLALGDNGTGSYSMHSDKTNNLSISLGSVLDSIGQVVNRVAIRKLCRINGFTDDEIPTWTHGDIEKVSVVDFAQAVTGLTQAGALEPDDALRSEARRLLNLKAEEAASFADEVMPATEEVEQIQADATPEPEPSATMGVDDAAEYLGMSRSRIMGALRRGQLPGGRIGNTWRIARTDLDKYLLGAHGAE